MSFVLLAFNSAMHALIGSTGSGKTFSFDLYRACHENVYYFKIEKTYTAKEFYLLLLSAVGVHDYDRRVPLKSMAERFASVLREKKTKTLLIFDEAGKFSSDMCEFFQTIRDSTEENVGIILSGTEKFRTDMESWRQKKHKGIPELFSRIWSWEDIPKPTENEKYQIVKMNGVTDPAVIKKIVKQSPDLRQVYQNVMQQRYVFLLEEKEAQMETAESK